MAMLVPASASDMRASEQIYFQSIDASASGGEIVTQFTIMGNVTMDAKTLRFTKSAAAAGFL